MAINSGTFSLVRFKILGGLPSFDLENLSTLIGKHKAKTLKLIGVTREIVIGWVAPESVEDGAKEGYWDMGHCRAGQGFLLRARVEKRRVPQSLCRLVFRDKVQEEIKRRGGKPLARSEKKAMLAHVNQELLLQCLPQVRFLDAYWNERRQELWIYHGGKSTVDQLTDLFIKTFAEPLGLCLVPMEPPLLGFENKDWLDPDSPRNQSIMRTLPQGLGEEPLDHEVQTHLNA